MKKTFRGLGLTLIVVLLAINLMACGLTDEEKEIVGNYKLIEVSIQGYPNINADTYDYFTLDFKSNKKCTVASKAGVTTYEAKANWKINDNGEVEVITKSGLAKATEVYTYKDGILSGTNTSVVEGVSITMTVKFQKIVEEAAE